MPTNISNQGMRRFRTWYSQYKTTHGGAEPPETLVSSYLQAQVEADAANATQSNALALREKEMANNLFLREKELSQQSSQFQSSLDLSRQQLKDAREAARIQGLANLGLVGIIGAPYIAKGAAAVGSLAEGLMGAGGTTIVSSTSAPVVGTAAGEIAGGAAATGSTSAAGATAGATGTASAGAIGSAAVLAAPAAAGFAGGEIVRNWVGDQPHQQVLGGVAGGAAAGAAIGSVVVPVPVVGTAIGAVVGGAVGGVVALVDEASFICSAINKSCGMSDEEKRILTVFRRHSILNHPNALRFYETIGPEITTAIYGLDIKDEILSWIKKEYISQVMASSRKGDFESAFKTYKDMFIGLVKRFSPDLYEAAAIMGLEVA